MRRSLVGAVMLIALIASPVAAQTEPVPTPPCPTSTEYPTVGLAGKHEDVDAPLLPDNPVAPEDSRVNYKYRIDVSGSAEKPFANKGNVSINVNWGNDGDFDLYVYDNQGSQIGSGANGFLTTRPESATLVGLPHCTDIRIEIVNFLAPPTLDMTLDTTISGLKP